MKYIGNSGITLIELMVVTAIVIVLAALAFPSISQLMDRSQSVNCASNMKQFGTAALTYRAEHNGFFPPGYLLPPLTSENENPQTGVNISKQLVDEGYLKILPYCPLSRVTPKGSDFIKSRKISQRQHFQNIGSYAINMFLLQTKMEALPGSYWGTYPYPGDTKMLFIAESYFSGIIWSLSQSNSALNGFDTGQIFIQPRNHGNNRLHFMFLDGHIALLAPQTTGIGSNGYSTYDWSEHFDSWGRNGRYVNMKRARE